jgi:hypothetical protein
LWFVSVTQQNTLKSWWAFNIIRSQCSHWSTLSTSISISWMKKYKKIYSKMQIEEKKNSLEFLDSYEMASQERLCIHFHVYIICNIFALVELLKLHFTLWRTNFFHIVWYMSKGNTPKKDVIVWEVWYFIKPLFVPS